MVSRFRTRSGSTNRTRRGLTALAAAVVLLLVMSSGGTSHAGPAGLTQSDGEFGPGTAKATAWAMRIAPAVGNLQLALTSGVSVSEVTNALAQSQSVFLNMGLIGTVLTAETCSGGEAALSPEDLPQPIRVDNRDGDVRLSEEERGLGLLGFRDVEALTRPQSSALAEIGNVNIDGLLKVSGVRSHAETTALDGQGREARAYAEADLSIGPLNLKGLRWDAVHRSGADYLSEGSFGIGSVGGVPLLGGDDLQDVEILEETLNTVLDATMTGLRIEFPRVIKITEPADLVRVTPLRIVFQDSELTTLILGVLLEGSREQREEMFDILSEQICQLAGALLVGDIALAIATGTGFLAFEIGGAEALSGEFVIGDAISIPGGAGPVGAVDGQEPVPTAAAPAPAPAPAPTSADTAGDADPRELAVAPAAELGPIERICETVHPFDWPSCSSGAAPLAGLLGLFATGAVFAWDFRRNRAVSA